MGMDEMVVGQINLRIDDIHNRQDNADAIVEKMREENSEFNSQIVTAMNDQTVEFSNIKTKQTIYWSIAVFVISLVLNFGIDKLKEHPEPEKKLYYNDRITEAEVTKRMQGEIDFLTKKLNEELSRRR